MAQYYELAGRSDFCGDDGDGAAAGQRLFWDNLVGAAVDFLQPRLE